MGFKMNGPSMSISYKGESGKQQKQNLNQDNPVAKHASAMNQLDPMHNGKPGVQKDDFKQFKSPATMVSPLNDKKEPKRVKIESEGMAGQGSTEYVRGGRKEDKNVRSVTIEKDYAGKDQKVVRRKKKDGSVKTKSKKISSKKAERIKKRKDKSHSSESPANLVDPNKKGKMKKEGKLKQSIYGEMRDKKTGKLIKTFGTKPESPATMVKKVVDPTYKKYTEESAPIPDNVKSLKTGNVISPLNKGVTRNSGDAPPKRSAEDEAELRAKNRARIAKEKAFIADKKAKKVWGSSSPATKKYKK